MLLFPAVLRLPAAQRCQGRRSARHRPVGGAPGRRGVHRRDRRRLGHRVVRPAEAGGEVLLGPSGRDEHGPTAGHQAHPDTGYRPDPQVQREGVGSRVVRHAVDAADTGRSERAGRADVQAGEPGRQQAVHPGGRLDPGEGERGGAVDGHLHRAVDQHGQPVADLRQQGEVGYHLRIGVDEQPGDPAHQPPARPRDRPCLAGRLGTQRQQRLGHVRRARATGAGDDKNVRQANHHTGPGLMPGCHHDPETVESRHRRAPCPSSLACLGRRPAPAGASGPPEPGHPPASGVSHPGEPRVPTILPGDRADVSNMSATGGLSLGMRMSPGRCREETSPPGRPAARPPDVTFGQGVRPARSPFRGQPRARSRWRAALIRARWVNACGKLPSASPDGPISSAYRPTWLA